MSKMQPITVKIKEPTDSELQYFRKAMGAAHIAYIEQRVIELPIDVKESHLLMKLILSKLSETHCNLENQ